MLDETVTVSFKLSGHRSREEATQEFRKDKDSAIRVQIRVIFQV